MRPYGNGGCYIAAWQVLSSGGLRVQLRHLLEGDVVGLAGAQYGDLGHAHDLLGHRQLGCTVLARPFRQARDFGVEIGHHDVSVKVFEHDLGPAVEEAGEDAIVLADGFSCQTQLRTLAGRDSMSLAELLATH